MNHFLSRIGRTQFGRHFLPILSSVTVCGYLGVHTISHGLIRNLFVASGPNGEPVQISDYLRDMITDVFAEVEKGGFHEDVLNMKSWNGPKPIIRWFTSSTLDPIVYGMTDFATGISIGVPNSYNYLQPQDLPDNVFAVKRLSIVRSPQGRESEDQNAVEDEAMLVKREKEPTVLVRKIDKNSKEGEDYINSLLLSENAKRFSLARELYVGDSYRPLLQCLALALSMTGAITTSRAQVRFFKIQTSHITHRLPGYILSGILFSGIYMFLSSAIDDFVGKKANERAKKLGENYVLGAEEYFKKQAIRDNILGISRSRYI
jgi:hypothetical protein